MKKLSLLCACTLACLGLTACGSSSTHHHSESANVHSEKIAKTHRRKDAKKRREKKRAAEKEKQKKEQQQQAATSSSQQQNNQQTTSQQTNTSNGSVNNADQAVAAARAKYGDNNGNVHWTYMVDADTGQPIRNPDGSYFVKGIANNGTMTGTEYSVNVGTDGSISSN